MKNELLNLYKVLSPYPEVKKLSKSLKKKIKLAILSNGTPSLLHELVNNNNLKNLFDDIFSIEEIKIYKPSSKVYEIQLKNIISKIGNCFLSAGAVLAVEIMDLHLYE